MSIIVSSVTGKAGNTNFDTTIPGDGSGLFKLLYGHVNITTDATVANRILELTLFDETPTEIIDIHAGAVVTASQTRHFSLMQGVYRETSFANTSLQVPIPADFIVRAGWGVRLSFTAGVAGDSFAAALVFEEYGERNARR